MSAEKEDIEMKEDIEKKEDIEIKEDIEKKDIKPVDRIDGLETLAPYISQQNNANNFVYISDIPQQCLDEPCMLGIDEAGRGPVLGPMVYGIAFCPLEKSDVLKTLGCADSKQLTEEKREIIFDDINKKDYARDTVGWAVEVISPNDISRSMFRRAKRSLNEVSMDSAIGLVNHAIERGVNIAEVYVDTVGPPEKYEAKLSALFPDFKITVAKKADSTYPIVSAASICAKVSRDHALKVWKFREGDNFSMKFGSGYPSDPATKAYLRNIIDPVFGFPRLVRFSWSTADTALHGKSIGVEMEDEDKENAKNAAKTNDSIKTFFKGDGEHHERHMYFRDRALENVADL